LQFRLLVRDQGRGLVSPSTNELALYFAVTSSLLDVFKLPGDDNKRFYFLLVIAFLAGFSERWARDTLLSFGAATPGPPTRKSAETSQPGSV
jgi:hypothetical protein